MQRRTRNLIHHQRTLNFIEVQPFPNASHGELITSQRPLKPIKWCRRLRKIKVKRALLYYHVRVVPIQAETEHLRERNGLCLELHILDGAIIRDMFREEFHQAPYFHMTGEELDDASLCFVTSLSCYDGIFKDTNDFEERKLCVYNHLMLRLWMKTIATIINIRGRGFHEPPQRDDFRRAVHGS